MRPRLDVCAWNLFGSVAIAAACGGQDAKNHESTAETTGGPECVTNQDCPGAGPRECIDGKCVYNGYDSSDDPYCRPEDCGPLEFCTGYRCVALPEPDACPDAPTLEEYIPLPNGTDLAAVALAFVDADGSAEQDLLVASPGGVSLVLGPGIDAPAPIPLPAPGEVLALFGGDVDGDGDQDVILADNANGGRLEVALGDGGAGFVAAAGAGMTGTATDAALGDFDGNGNIDIALARSDGVQVWLADGAGSFVAGAKLATAAESPLAAGSLVADTRTDLVTLSSDPTAVVWWDMATAMPSALNGVEPGTTPEDLLVLNVFDDGDGVEDLLRIDHVPDLIGLRARLTGYRNVNGGLSPGPNYGGGARVLPELVERLFAGDLDGDGRLDAVLTGQPNLLFVVYGDANSTIPCVTDYSSPETPATVAVGDFDGDARDELAIGSGETVLVVGVLE